MKRIMIGAAVGVLILAACGDDDSGSGDSLVSEEPADDTAVESVETDDDTTTGSTDEPDDSEEFVEATPETTVEDSAEERSRGETFPLEGTTWILRSFTVDGEEVAVDEGVEATLLVENGAVALLTGCNAGSGPIEFDDTTLTAGNVALTRRACFGPAADAEVAVVATFKGTADYVVEGDTLVIGREGPKQTSELVYTAS